MTVEEFGARLQEEREAYYRREYPGMSEASMIAGTRVAVVPGRKYTKVDIDHSGKYMVVNATGEIFGVKAYGVIHRGHQYGTLDTVDDWNWGGYEATRKVKV